MILMGKSYCRDCYTDVFAEELIFDLANMFGFIDKSEVERLRTKKYDYVNEVMKNEKLI